MKPRLGTNRFGSECVTYEGIGVTKKWKRLETYGPKLVENIVQAISRDILCHAMRTLRCCRIVMHIHDELVIEADPAMIERWFRSFKYEEAYLTEWGSIKEARAAIGNYIYTYNFERCHSSIGNVPPALAYYPSMLYEAAKEAAA